jgi:hypothetical protein
MVIKINMRRAVSQAKPIFPPSVADKYIITPAHPVPDHIIRPDYVGKKP